MKALYCYDGPLREDEKGNHYGIALNNTMFSRYYQIVDKLTVGINIEKITEKEISNKYSKINLENFQVSSLPKLNTIHGILFNRSRVKRKLYEEISNADLLIIRLPSFIGNISVEIANVINKPYLVEVVGCPWDALWNHSFKGKMVALPSYFAMKKSLKNAPNALYVTNEFLQRRYPCKGNTLGCSDVELPIIDESVLKRRVDKINSMKKDTSITLGTTAAVNVKYKGQEYVIKAISKLNKEGYNFNYHLAGGGDNSYLKSVAEKYDVLDKVEFIGILPHEKVFGYLDNIDIYIQPSKTEGLPRSLVEAMSRGCPSIGSSVGGIPELLIKDCIFSNGSVDEICILLKMMDKKKLLEEAHRSFEKAKEFNKKLLDDKRKAFYKEIADNVGGRGE